MKKTFLMAALLLPALAMAQDSISVPDIQPLAEPAAATVGQPLRFGCFSYSDVLHAMGDYAIAERNLADLRLKYEAEQQRTEDEFNKKYEEFLDGQRDFAPSIRDKRQAELEELMQKNVAFKQEARRLLQQAEDDAMVPLREKIDAAVRAIAEKNGYAFVLNTDGHVVPFIDATRVDDITPQLKEALK